jgi:hypothetical protein
MTCVRQVIDAPAPSLAPPKLWARWERLNQESVIVVRAP